MTRTIPLSLSLAGPDTPAIAAVLAEHDWLPKGEPLLFRVDGKEAPATAKWAERIATASALTAVIPGQGTLDYHGGKIVRLKRDVVAISEEGLLDAFVKLPFEVASLGPIYDEWSDEEWGEYEPPSFSDRHYPLGWACAFKGAGYRRLVSRRWLDTGPWKLVRRGDLSVAFFHDLEADARTALEQARPGHEEMGIGERGGFIQSAYLYSSDLKGIYDAAARKLKVVVHGRDVSPVEMRDMCVARRDQVLGPDKPIDAVAYVFIEEASARAHQRELWRRELECWAIVDGREVRLDGPG